jgi:hypothetical protein
MKDEYLLLTEAGEVLGLRIHETFNYFNINGFEIYYFGKAKCVRKIDFIEYVISNNILSKEELAQKMKKAREKVLKNKNSL